jgi:hypothetical protein
MSFLVSTERLGRPGRESGRLERYGIVQRRRAYPTASETPTATCHLQPDTDAPSLCRYPSDGLAPVPQVASVLT